MCRNETNKTEFEMIILVVLTGNEGHTFSLLNTIASGCWKLSSYYMNLQASLNK